MSRLIIAGGTIVTMDAARRIMVGDVIIEDGRIVDIVQSHNNSADIVQSHNNSADIVQSHNKEPNIVRAHNNEPNIVQAHNKEPNIVQTHNEPPVMVQAHNEPSVMVQAHNGAKADGAIAQRIDARGCIVAPGLVQAHTHLCQTLCRGTADDLPLLEWLRRRVWPYEAALDERSMRAAARVAAAELLLGGTTAILDMGTVHETDALADAVAASGLRAVIGKAMMDMGDGVPARLRESTRRSLDESDALRGRWQGATDGRLGYAYAPRFVLSCTEELLREVAARVQQGARLHTHASEQEAEIEVVRRERGCDNIVYLEGLGLGGPRAALAHCVHATGAERAHLAASGTHVVHCPSSNLKLASGIAPIPEMLAQGIHVALGADGAPCNNNLDAFVEMRLAALLHKPRAGAGAMPAATVLELATRGGAAALGLGDTIGSIETGKRADLIVVDPRVAHATPAFDPVATLVYACQSRDVRDVIVDGRVLVRDGALTELSGLEHRAVVAEGQLEAERTQARLR